DATAHQVMEPGQPAHAEIVAHFGAEILDPAGRIDRPRLGAIVFADAGERAALNAIVHPRVYEAQALWLAEVAARDPRAIAGIDAALMIETGSWRRFDQLVVVHCQPEIQLARLMERNGLTREAAEARIAAQLPVAEKLRYANFTIDTSAGFDDTRRQVELLYRQLRELAASPLPQL
ncbi:MAG: dephospho-CoA kinase, partial [Acidobacteriota bacterium]